MKARMPPPLETAYGGGFTALIVRSLRSNARSFIRCREKVSESITHDSPNLSARTIASASDPAGSHDFGQTRQT